MSAEKGSVKSKTKLDKATFVLPAVLVLVAIIVGLVAPAAFEEGANAAKSFTTTYFGWFYALGTTLLVVFCLWIAFSKHGNIKLGGKDAKPEMSFISWFFISVMSGIAIGYMFWGVAEPLGNFTSPPAFTGWEANSPEAAEGALKYVYMHWGIHPYAMYTAIGICCALVFWNAKKKFQISSTLYPILGEKANGTIGKIINGVCIFAVVGCMGTSLGLGITQLVDGLNYVTGANFDPAISAFVIVAGMALLYIAAAVSGIHKGIKALGNLNMYIYIALLIWVLIFGGTLFIANNTLTSIGEYIALVVPQSLYLEPAIQSGWVEGWTIFYWAWWLSAAPIVGLFLIKLAKGRTLRQFVVINMFAPVLLAFLWFGILGSSAIGMEMSGAGLAAEIAENGVAVALYAFAENLPLTPVLIVLIFAAIVISFVTMAQSMTLTVSDMSTDDRYLEEQEAKGKGSPTYLKIFWGAMMALIAFTLYFSGGLSALQTSVIVCGLPILILALVMVVSCIKWLKNRDEYDLTLTDDEREFMRREREEKELSEAPIAAIEEASAAESK